MDKDPGLYLGSIHGGFLFRGCGGLPVGVVGVVTELIDRRNNSSCGAIYDHVCGARHVCDMPDEHNEDGEHECLCGFTWEDDDIDNNAVEDDE